MTHPALARGRSALTELKHGIISARQQHQDKTTNKDLTATAAAEATNTNPDGTKMTVLDRIRLKQLAKAAAPLPPSAAELERRAALQRVADVAAVVRMLTRAGQSGLPRQAYPLSTLLQKLRDSLRTPISGEESSRVVRLIASEIAPEWLKMVTVGGRETVIVHTMSEPSVSEITARAQNFA
jgi:hypothetical protein